MTTQATAQATAERLNARFRNGHPSDDLRDAGVVYHQFDSFDDPTRPWRVIGCYDDGYVDRIAMASGDGGDGGDGGGAAALIESTSLTPYCARDEVGRDGDRVSASLMWGGMTAAIAQPHSDHSVRGLSVPGIPLFDPRIGGVVLRPESLRLLCSYPTDGGSVSKQCDPPGVPSPADDATDGDAACVPGCYAAGDVPRWCTAEVLASRHANKKWAASSHVANWCRDAPWRSLEGMMRFQATLGTPIRGDGSGSGSGSGGAPNASWLVAQDVARGRRHAFYNELVLAADAYNAAMPAAVEAFFYAWAGPVDGGPTPCDAACIHAVQQVRAAFVRSFGLGDEDEPPPLLRLNLSDWRTPWSPHPVGVSN